MRKWPVDPLTNAETRSVPRKNESALANVRVARMLLGILDASSMPKKQHACHSHICERTLILAWHASCFRIRERRASVVSHFCDSYFCDSARRSSRARAPTNLPAPVARKLRRVGHDAAKRREAKPTGASDSGGWVGAHGKAWSIQHRHAPPTARRWRRAPFEQRRAYFHSSIARVPACTVSPPLAWHQPCQLRLYFSVATSLSTASATVHNALHSCLTTILQMVDTPKRQPQLVRCQRRRNRRSTGWSSA